MYDTVLRWIRFGVLHSLKDCYWNWGELVEVMVRSTTTYGRREGGGFLFSAMLRRQSLWEFSIDDELHRQCFCARLCSYRWRELIRREGTAKDNLDWSDEGSKGRCFLFLHYSEGSLLDYFLARVGANHYRPQCGVVPDISGKRRSLGEFSSDDELHLQCFWAR